MATKKTTIQNYDKPPASLDGHPFFGFRLDPEQLVFANSIWNKDKRIVFVDAPAGVGKSFVAIATGVLLSQYHVYEKLIYIVSPVFERRQGFLKGTQREKSEIYFDNMYSALIKLNVNPMLAVANDAPEQDKCGDAFIHCMTHTYLRGVNFENAVVILDESQNFTTNEIKKCLTRCADSCKVIITGHHGQCDLENPDQSGFIKYINHFKDDERTAVCTLTQNHRGWIASHADELKI